MKKDTLSAFERPHTLADKQTENSVPSLETYSQVFPDYLSTTNFLFQTLLFAQYPFH